ncbi:PD-(D/E)XK nuclease family protein [Candidatus Pacearchaeota archaeon]|nr:PD-(D/E)XK nuclease family protein [Candidatus Pacearchaeota archaeon]
MHINRLSASAYKCEDQCPFKYFLQYHLGIRGEQTFAADYGRVIHEILERYAFAKKNGTDQAWHEGQKPPSPGPFLTAEDIEENYIDILLAEGWRSETMSKLWPSHRYVRECEKNCDECPFFKDGMCGIVNHSVEEMSGYDPDAKVNKGKKAKDKKVDFNFGCPLEEYKEGIRQIEDVIFDEKPYGPFNRKIVDAERYFRITIEDGGRKYICTGLMDLTTELDEDTIEIFDYKTGRFKMSYPDCLTDIQLMMYYYAAKRLYPEYKNHMITIYYLCGGKKQITPPFGDMTEHEVCERIKKMWNEIEHDIFPQRRCDKPNGAVEFDHKCEYLCDSEFCELMHPKLISFVTHGGNIHDLENAEQLEEFLININDKYKVDHE